MKAIFISFNQAYYETIVNIMDRNNLKGFTYWDVVQGRGGKTGEPHYGNYARPTLNPAILTIVEDEKADHFLEILHNSDKETEARGLRVFIWNIEKTI